ncbi:MAG: hypothetical protein NTV88_03965, partial [Candidatus Micrarchaeota archaeon]|nr:hypothetical protein [Candidatus Micrarchaeota archaeon]
MKALFVMILVAALLLYGCAGASGQQQAPAPQQNTQQAAIGQQPPAGSEQQPPAPPAENISTTPPAPPADNSTVTPPSPPAATGITAAQLAAHNLDTDCWIAYQGKVYDVTSFIPKHPGGEGKIVPLCGTSGQFESTFTAKHGTSKVGVLESQPSMGSY